jgi:hypothetical protein
VLTGSSTIDRKRKMNVERTSSGCILLYIHDWFVSRRDTARVVLTGSVGFDVAIVGVRRSSGRLR